MTILTNFMRNNLCSNYSLLKRPMIPSNIQIFVQAKKKPKKKNIFQNTQVKKQRGKDKCC